MPDAVLSKTSRRSSASRKRPRPPPEPPPSPRPPPEPPPLDAAAVASVLDTVDRLEQKLELQLEGDLNFLGGPDFQGDGCGQSAAGAVPANHELLRQDPEKVRGWFFYGTYY